MNERHALPEEYGESFVEYIDNIIDSLDDERSRMLNIACLADIMKWSGLDLAQHESQTIRLLCLRLGIKPR